MAQVTKTGSVSKYTNSGGAYTVTVAYTDPPPPTSVTHTNVDKTFADDLKDAKIANKPVKVTFDDADADKTISVVSIE